MSEHCTHGDDCCKPVPHVRDVDRMSRREQLAAGDRLDRILNAAARPSIGRSDGEKREHQLAMRHLLKSEVPKVSREDDDIDPFDGRDPNDPARR